MIMMMLRPRLVTAFTAALVLALTPSARPQTAPPARPAITPLPAVAAPVVSTPATKRLPLPKAMIRLSIPDLRAFDGGLGGGFEKALHGTLPADDGVALGFSQSQVGTKLQDQWSRFQGENVLSLQTLLDLQVSSLALAVLNVGHLEMALVAKTPLSALPDLFEAGTSRIDHGLTYHLVRTGAADEGANPDTRMGLAWSLENGVLVVSTSERAMKLALAAVSSNERFSPKLDGLASLELDMDALRKDLYFKREFLFGSLATFDDSRGPIGAALRVEAGRFVEVREGALSTLGARGATFEAGDALSSGFVPDRSSLLSELRRGILEPIPEPGLLPLLGVAPLPPGRAQSAEDRYATNIEIPLPENGTLAEGGEIEAWKALLSSEPVAGFGYVITRSHSRLLAIPWPEARDREFDALIAATLSRRGARLAPEKPASDGREYVFGPGLKALSWRRAGDFIWLAPSLADLVNPPKITWSSDVLRFAKINLGAVREEGNRWRKIEGPRADDAARPLSDRVLGLLGWMPSVRTLEVERRAAGSNFSERVVFSSVR